MIQKVNIKNFGSFKHFDWNINVLTPNSEVAQFKKLNVMFGRNYSGKTTFSRIVQSLETGTLPAKYSAPDFSVVTDSTSLSHEQIPSTDLNVRVYNRDFVNKHLKFLVDDTGDITPFAIVGSENNAIETKIHDLEIKLGSLEAKSGLRFELSITKSKFDAADDRHKNAQKALSRKLREKANKAGSGMKHNSQFFGDINYSLPKIEKDIAAVTADQNLMLDHGEQARLQKLVKEEALVDANVMKFEPKGAELQAKAEELLGKKVRPSVAIQSLLSDSMLQEWVAQGVPLHRESRTSCGFCNAPLPEGFWSAIDNHFNKESKLLSAALEEHAEAINVEVGKVRSLKDSSKPSLYSEFCEPFANAKKKLDDLFDAYVVSLNAIQEVLQKKAKNVFEKESCPSIVCGDLMSEVGVLNDIIRASNEKTQTLTEDQVKARKALRLNEVGNFIADIDYEAEIQAIAEIETEKGVLSEAYGDSKQEVQQIENEIESLRLQLNDESKGAAKVNELLAKYFGHESLRLVAEEVDSSSAFKFKVMRGTSPAFNLSEGECSLLAFCYFIAKLDLDSNSAPLTIFIDDPISSLDSNHVFFIYSLIESLIASPKVDANNEKIMGADGKPVYRYRQLFISTHNLEFLKYLKRLSRPKKNHEQFLIVGEADSSKIKLMPNYLKLYITEFNYLFAEICKCADIASPASEHHCFYNFGNNLRKFLEAFLFFKYPFASRDQEDHKKRVAEFFDGDPCDAVLVQRLTNELSHLGVSFDRSGEPIDHAEITKLAKFVLAKIRDSDSRQYECLLESVRQVDPLVEAIL